MDAQAGSGRSRRGFLGAAMVGGAAVAAGASSTTAMAASSGGRRSAYRESNRVDLHAHHLAPDYVAALHAAGITAIGGIPIPEWSPESALQFMDNYGIRFQMLSVSDPGVSFLAGDAAAALAATCNDYAAQVRAQYPNRFGGFAVVSPDPTAAAAEVVRALDTLKLDGVGLLSSYRGVYLGDPRFEPVLEELNSRGSWVFVHPTAVAADDKPTLPLPDFVYEYPFDTTRTILSLMFNASFQRYPRIRWQFAHGGGTIPMLRFRAKALADGAKQFGPLLGLPDAASILTGDSAIRDLQRAHYDTALVADPPALAAVNGISGVEQIVFGSDWPFASRLYPSKGDPQPALSESFSASERRKIERLNALGQFKQLRGVVPSR